jgi:hypothetical protein
MKLEDTMCIGFQNIGGIPAFSSHPKNDILCSFILKHNFDIFGIAETNLRWSALPAESQFYERTRNVWDKTHSSIAYNCTNPSKTRQVIKGQSAFQQYGGVALLSTTQAPHRVLLSGRDITGLSRWTWTQYQGKASVSLKVVSAYRVCISDSALGTYSQHVNHLYAQDDNRCPRQAFLDDLKTDLQRWILAGEQVIVMLDANGDIRDGAVQAMFSEMGMREVLLEYNSDLLATSTYSRNFQDVPIDGAFATPSIHIQPSWWILRFWRRTRSRPSESVARCFLLRCFWTFGACYGAI